MAPYGLPITRFFYIFTSYNLVFSIICSVNTNPSGLF